MNGALARAVGLTAAVALGCSGGAGSAGTGVGAGPDVPKTAADLVWTEAAPCPLARFEANGVVVGDELWVMGGFVSSALEVTRRVDIYQPATDTWRAGPDLPGAETHIAAVAVDASAGDIVVAGGLTGNFVPSTRAPPTADVWRWSAAGGQWSAGPALPAAGAAFSWALLGTQLHLAGGLGADGNTDTDAHIVWDLAGAAAWTSAAPLPLARNHGGGAAAGGLFYAIAGRHDWNEIAGDVANVDAFDPAAGTWTARAAIPGARSEIGASTSVLADGRILVVGGSLPGIKPSADVLAYDPATDVWWALPSLPAPRKGAVARQIGQRLVVTTGSPTSVDPTDTTFVGCCL
jgi:hypothetical protein